MNVWSLMLNFASCHLWGIYVLFTFDMGVLSLPFSVQLFAVS